ncbi:NeuD/PglB/VioB family sugar acetyltransferase [Pendulispora rubella]|uniref:NeuD/PglB/VioB family sugar acetyltransferase n=1 Tax=Pendulispora rubella TaxID=2741070 RepID=A0ABZ2LBW3_9BACT
MARELIVLGGGEHARVVIDAARSRPGEWTELGYSDRQPVPATDERLGLSWLGQDDEVLEKYGERAFFVLGVGDPRRRRLIAERHPGVRWANVVHLNARVSPSVQVGHGIVVMAGAILNTGAKLGDHAIVNTGAIVEHDVSVGTLVHVGPAVAIGGGALIGDRATLGLGARIRDHVTVGADAVVGMGAVVVGNVETGLTVVGVPARPWRK